jgi:hypothetical protein
MLSRVPRPRVEVDAGRKTGEHSLTKLIIPHEGEVLSLGAYHEFGHHLEKHGGIELFALAGRLLVQRAHGTETERLKEGKKRYRGAFLDRYDGVLYDHGASEMISQGVRRLLVQARDFMLEDGHYALSLLAALQAPGRSQAAVGRR